MPGFFISANSSRSRLASQCIPNILTRSDLHRSFNFPVADKQRLIDPRNKSSSINYPHPAEYQFRFLFLLHQSSHGQLPEQKH